MIKLLIIADDFTGALDTGVQFASEGIKTRVLVYNPCEKLIDDEDNDTDVLVIDAETRHLSKEKAYKTIYDIVKKSKEENIKFLYKKTDSALRGNIGSELSAMLKASNEKSLPFIPAFPKMNRITKNGVHYIDNIPVDKSVFGQDPFEPVKYSSVKEIIKDQSSIETIEIPVANKVLAKKSKGILIYDAQSEEDLQNIGSQILKDNMCNIMAGCAGFAEVLPRILGLSGNIQSKVKLSEKLLVVCGSVNPITKRQLDYGEKYGFKRIHLSPEQKIKEKYWETEEGLNKLKKIKYSIQESDCCILDSNDKDSDNETFEYANLNGVSVEEIRVNISQTMGYLLKKIIDKNVNATFLVTGGDTLLGFMKKVGVNELTPICELTKGCVLTQMEYGEKIYHVISKSGGFGEENLIKTLIDLLKSKEINVG